MKKILSVLLAVLIMATSCVSAFTAFAAESCTDGHNVTAWTKSNEYMHQGSCTSCGTLVKKTHTLEVQSTVAPKCEAGGSTIYKCKDCDYTETKSISMLGHDINTVTITYFTEDGVSKRTIEKTCYNAGCTIEAYTGNAGSTNTCLKCGNRTLLKEVTTYPTCVSKGKTEYTCSSCGVYTDNETSKTAHNYVAVVYPATCTQNGYTEYTCNCSKYSASAFDRVYRDDEILAKGHNMEKPGESYTYTYNTDGTCEISGTCADCNVYVSVSKKYVTPDPCPTCGNNVTKKIIYIPLNCEESAKITYTCPLNHNVNVDALPVGHVAKTTTYTYENGVYVGAEVDCHRCGVQAIVDDTYKNDTRCGMRNCNGVVAKRVVVAPTCSKNGYTLVTCEQCGDYTETTTPSKSHNAEVAEWSFDYESDTYTMKASCRNYGCGGYEKSGAIGILGKCVDCGKTGTLVYKKVTHSDCSAKEYTEFKCKNCCQPDSESSYGLQSRVVVGTKTRNHDNITLDIKATCTTSGGTKTTCKNCYYTTVENEVPAIGHSLSIELIDYANNKKNGICKICNEPVETTAGNAPKCTKCTDGRLTKQVVVKPNCGESTNGYTETYCTNHCHDNGVDYYVLDSSIVPYAHKYGNWIITKAETCKDPGQRKRICELCEKEHVEEIPANTYTDASGQVQPAHEFYIVEKGYAATCTTDGLTDLKYCILCDEFFYSEVIPATGHLLSPGTTNEKFCSRCNCYIVEELEDGYVKVPVLDENGNQVYEIDKDGNRVPVYKTTPCSCMHHNEDGLAKFFFKFILFFCQLFGINKVCDCGALHY